MTSRMHTEIHQQPEVLEEVLASEWVTALHTARTLRARGFRSVMITARGTSDNAALYAKYLFETLLGVPTALASPSTFTLYEADMDLKDTLVIGVSQSGESKDVVRTVTRARELGADTLTITNDPESSLARAAEFHLFLRAGEEQSVAATKTYTAELLLLYLFVIALGGTEDPGPEVRLLPEQARRVLMEGRWENLARYRYTEHLVTVSRGYNFATAKETALKLMETTYVMAEAFSAADLRHGPIAMIGQDFPVVAIVPPGRAEPSMRVLTEALIDKGAELLIVGADDDISNRAAARFLMPVSSAEALSPVLYALPSQMLALDLASLKGLNPDSPRGLSKVTETW